MAAIGDVLVKLRADSSRLGRDLDRAANKMQRAGRKFAAIGNELSLSLTLPIAAFGVASVQAAADYEKLEKSLVSAMGSTKAASEELKKLKESAQAPGLGFEQAVKGSVRLQSVGLSAEKSRQSLEVFGNAIALVGGSAADLDGVSLALAQIASKGKISAEEINQLAERVPQIRMALQDAFGTADTEVLQDMGIDFNTFIDGVNASMSKLPKASDTFSNSLANMQMALKEAFAEVGKEILTTTNLTEKIKGLTERVVNAIKWFKDLPDPVKKAGLIIAGLAASAGPITKVMAALKMLRAAFLSFGSVLLANPIGIVVAGIAALIAGMVALYKHSAEVRVVLDSLWEAIGPLFTRQLEIVLKKIELLAKGVQKLAQGLAWVAEKAWEAVKSLNPIAGMQIEAAAAAESKKPRGKSGGMFGDAAFLMDAAGKEFVKEPITPQVSFDIPAIEESAAAAGDAAGSMFEQKLTPHFRKIDQAVGSQFEETPDLFRDAKMAFLEFADVVSNKGVEVSDKIGDVVDKFKQVPEAVNSGFSDDVVSTFSEKADLMRTKLEGLSKPAETVERFGTVFNSAMNKTSSALSKGANSFKQFGRSVTVAVAQVVKSLVIQSIAKVIADSFQKFGILGAVVGGIAAGGVSALFDSFISKVQAPALAKGGLAFGPTMAMVGDNPGASVDPEVIAPLSKLKDIIGGGMGAQTGTFRIDYETLDLLLDLRAERKTRLG